MIRYPRPGQAKTVSTTIRAGENRADLQAEQRDHGEHRVAQRVLEQHGALAESFGPRRADVILLQGVEHRPAGETHDRRSRERAERDRRQDDAREAHPATGRQPIETDGDEQDQHQAQPEVGHGLTEERKHSTEDVDCAAAPDRGDDPERDADGERDGQTRGAQLDGRQQAFGHDLRRGPGGTERLTEFELRNVDQESTVLLNQRIVEPDFIFDLFDLFGRGLDRRQPRDRIADSAAHEEDDRDDTEDDRDRPEQPGKSGGAQLVAHCRFDSPSAAKSARSEATAARPPAAGR